MASPPWHIRLTSAAERDFRDILVWTGQTFGAAQAAAYSARLLETLLALEEGPEPVGSRSRDEIGPGLRTLHMGSPGRHFIVYRGGAHVIEILRILHDAMDLPRHIEP